jgi:hypothetical protein
MKKKKLRPRLPREAQEVLRHRGGAHSQNGYNRAKERRKNKVW